MISNRASSQKYKTSSALLIILIVFSTISIILSGCGGLFGGGGGSSDTFAPAGTQTSSREINFDGSASTIFSPESSTRISIPAGAMNTGSPVKLVTWSEQRSLAQLVNMDPDLNAIDFTFIPAQLGSNSITVEMPGPGGLEVTVILTAFGPSGKRIALPQTPDSTSTLLKSTLNADIVEFITGKPATFAEPVTIQLAVMRPKPTALKLNTVPMVAPTLTRVWTRPETGKIGGSRTKYASRKRIAITIHGILNTPADLIELTRFLDTEKQNKDGVESEKSLPFDAIDVFGYGWYQPIQLSGEQFAANINSKYGDKTKYDVHIYAHSMGGLVSRIAIENHACPSVSNIVTFGTPHKGVPMAGIKMLVLLFDLQMGNNSIIPAFNSFATGVNQLIEGSDAIEQLRTNTQPEGVRYRAVGGTKSDLALAGVVVGEANHKLYLALGKAPDDGIVPSTSAFGGPATQAISVEYNHGALVGADVNTYWPINDSAQWLKGMNRKIDSMTFPAPFVSMAISEGRILEVTAKDFEGDTLSPEAAFEGRTTQSPLVWTAADSSIVSISNKSKFSATLTGLKNGTTNVTVTDPDSGKTASIEVRVGNLAVTLTDFGRPMRLLINERYDPTVVGTVPTGAKYVYTLTGPGTIARTASELNFSGTILTKTVETAGSVHFVAPANQIAVNGTMVNSTLTLEIKDTNNVTLATTSRVIQVGGTSFYYISQGIKKYHFSLGGAGFLNVPFSTTSYDTYSVEYQTRMLLGLFTAKGSRPVSGRTFNYNRIVSSPGTFVIQFGNDPLNGNVTNAIQSGSLTINSVNRLASGLDAYAYSIELQMENDGEPVTGYGAFQMAP